MPPAKLIVQKYGGTSVGTIDRIKHVASHIASSVKNGDSVIAVISAMGDQTDDLLQMAHAISSHPPRRELDMLLTAGERIAMALVSIALNDIGCEAVSLTGSQSGIITDTVHGNARISRVGAQRIQDYLTQKKVVIVAGFQGVSAETKEITTLGRGGSDLSAIALAAALKANHCQLYKDVDGVCSAEPRVVSNAKILKNISWETMMSMAWTGATVLHPRGAHLAGKYEIPVEIRSSFHLEREGTLVSGRQNMEQLVIQAITHKSKISLLTGRVQKNDIAGLNRLREWLWQHGESSQVQSQYFRSDQVEFTWTIPTSLISEFKKQMATYNMSLSGTQFDECGIITIIGSGFWQSPEVMATVSSVIREPLFLDIKNQEVTIVVPENLVNSVVVDLHSKLVN